MNSELWASIDSYIGDLFIPNDPALNLALAASEAAGLPHINVSAAQGKFLMLLAKIKGAKSILEIGTLGGYSTIWLARALPEDGRLVTIEYEPKHFEVAKKNVTFAGFGEIVDLRLGRGIDVLPQIFDEGLGPFDFVFIDADKPSTPHYFAWALKLTKPGSVIIVDNVIRDGKVIDEGSENESVVGIRKFNEMAAVESRVSLTEIQTVGAKGYDGFALAVVL